MIFRFSCNIERRITEQIWLKGQGNKMLAHRDSSAALGIYVLFFFLYADRSVKIPTKDQLEPQNILSRLNLSPMMENLVPVPKRPIHLAFVSKV